MPAMLLIILNFYTSNNTSVCCSFTINGSYISHCKIPAESVAYILDTVLMQLKHNAYSIDPDQFVKGHPDILECQKALSSANSFSVKSIKYAKFKIACI